MRNQEEEGGDPKKKVDLPPMTVPGVTLTTVKVLNPDTGKMEFRSQITVEEDKLEAVLNATTQPLQAGMGVTFNPLNLMWGNDQDKGVLKTLGSDPISWESLFALLSVGAAAWGTYRLQKISKSLMAKGSETKPIFILEFNGVVPEADFQRIVDLVKNPRTNTGANVYDAMAESFRQQRINESTQKLQETQKAINEKPLKVEDLVRSNTTEVTTEGTKTISETEALKNRAESIVRNRLAEIEASINSSRPWIDMADGRGGTVKAQPAPFSFSIGQPGNALDELIEELRAQGKQTHPDLSSVVRDINTQIDAQVSRYVEGAKAQVYAPTLPSISDPRYTETQGGRLKQFFLGETGADYKVSEAVRKALLQVARDLKMGEPADLSKKFGEFGWAIIQANPDLKEQMRKEGYTKSTFVAEANRIMNSPDVSDLKRGLTLNPADTQSKVWKWVQEHAPIRTLKVGTTIATFVALLGVSYPAGQWVAEQIKPGQTAQMQQNAKGPVTGATAPQAGGSTVTAPAGTQVVGLTILDETRSIEGKTYYKMADAKGFAVYPKTGYELPTQGAKSYTTSFTYAPGQNDVHIGVQGAGVGKDWPMIGVWADNGEQAIQWGAWSTDHPIKLKLEKGHKYELKLEIDRTANTWGGTATDLTTGKSVAIPAQELPQRIQTEPGSFRVFESVF